MVQLSINSSTRRGTSPRPSRQPSPYRPGSPAPRNPVRPANDPIGLPNPANDNDRPVTRPAPPRRPTVYVPPQVRRSNQYRLNRFLTAYQHYNDATASIAAITSQFTSTGYSVNSSLNCGPGAVVINRAWTVCGGAFANPYSAVGRTPYNATQVFVWGRHLFPHAIVPGTGWYERGYVVNRASPLGRWAQSTAPRTGTFPNVSPQPRQQPQPLPGVAQQPVIPRPLQPYVGHNPLPGGQPVTRPRPGTDSWSPPRPLEDPFSYQFPRTEPHLPRPPRPLDRERKLGVDRTTMWLLHRAHDFSEGLDFLDALYEALPVQYRTSKSGRTRNNSRAGPGRPYATPLDKARDLYRNWHRVNLPEAIRNIAYNALEDAVLGRVNAGADSFSNRNLGGRRLVLTG